MIKPSTYYKLVDPSGKIVNQGSARVMRMLQRRMGKDWQVVITSKQFGEQFEAPKTETIATNKFGGDWKKTTQTQKGNQMSKSAKQNQLTRQQRTTISCELNLDGGELIILMPLTLPPSASGKTLVLASTRGNLSTTATYNGKPITIGVNAYVKK